MRQTPRIEDDNPIKKESCMERAKKQAQRHREMYGPSNRELLSEIKVLQNQVAELIKMFKIDV